MAFISVGYFSLCLELNLRYLPRASAQTTAISESKAVSPRFIEGEPSAVLNASADVSAPFPVLSFPGADDNRVEAFSNDEGIGTSTRPEVESKN